MILCKKSLSFLVIMGMILMLINPVFAVDQKKSADSGKKLINLNTADAKQLEELPRVGPKMAQRIMEYRKANGGFKKIQDLLKVKGIGQKTFDKLKHLITV